MTPAKQVPFQRVILEEGKENVFHLLMNDFDNKSLMSIDSDLLILVRNLLLCSFVM